MNRRKFLKVLGLGALIPFIKTEEKEKAWGGYVGVEGAEEKLHFSNTTSIFPLKLYNSDYKNNYYTYVAHGIVSVKQVWRDGRLVDPSEYVVGEYRIDGVELYKAAFLNVWVAGECKLIPAHTDNRVRVTVVHFKKEQIDFSGRRYWLYATENELYGIK